MGLDLDKPRSSSHSLRVRSFVTSSMHDGPCLCCGILPAAHTQISSASTSSTRISFAWKLAHQTSQPARVQTLQGSSARQGGLIPSRKNQAPPPHHHILDWAHTPHMHTLQRFHAVRQKCLLWYGLPSCHVAFQHAVTLDCMTNITQAYCCMSDALTHLCLCFCFLNHYVVTRTYS